MPTAGNRLPYRIRETLVVACTGAVKFGSRLSLVLVSSHVEQSFEPGQWLVNCIRGLDKVVVELLLQLLNFGLCLAESNPHLSCVGGVSACTDALDHDPLNLVNEHLNWAWFIDERDAPKLHIIGRQVVQWSSRHQQHGNLCAGR